MLLWVLGCLGEGAPPEAKPVVEVPGATKGAGAAQGVSEVVTPPGILRATELRDERAPATLDVWFEADKTTAAGLKKLLEDNGFKQIKYHKYYKRCLEERAARGIGQVRRPPIGRCQSVLN